MTDREKIIKEFVKLRDYRRTRMKNTSAVAELDDLIPREAALDAIFGCFNVMESKGFDMTVAKAIAEGILNEVPAVDAAPVVHGWWMSIPNTQFDQKMCSVCGDYFCCQINYCPNCGAKMEGEQYFAFTDQNGAEYADNPTV